MPNNDFLPFATGAGANVENQATYASDPSTAAGFSAGIAQSQKLNKVWRQSSFVSSAVSQLIVNQLGIDILDNGDLSGYTANLEAAILRLYPRQVLNAPQSYYINPVTGSDNFDGETSTSPWQTLARAAAALMDDLDLNGQPVTIYMADGQYGPLSIDSPMISQGSITFQGNLNNPAAVSVNVINGNCVYTSYNGYITLQGMSFQATGTGLAGNAIVADGGYPFFQNCNFGPCGGAHILSTGGYFRAIGPYSILASAPYHIYCRVQGAGDLAPVAGGSAFAVTILNSPTFTTFIRMEQGGYVGGCFANGVSFNGPAIGQKFNVSTQAMLNTGGGGINYFPGSTPGAVDASTFAIYQ
jgi:hypothetical protein